MNKKSLIKAASFLLSFIIFLTLSANAVTSEAALNVKSGSYSILNRDLGNSDGEEDDSSTDEYEEVPLSTISLETIDYTIIEGEYTINEIVLGEREIE